MLVSSDNIGNKFLNNFLILYLFSIPQINGIRCNNITHCSVENGSNSGNKFSQMDSLPNFLTHGAPLCAGFACVRSSAINLGKRLAEKDMQVRT